MIWFLFIISLLLCVFFRRNTFNKTAYVASLLYLIILSAMTGFGSIAGQDHQNYVDIYVQTSTFDGVDSILSLISNYSIEPGYQLLNVFGNALNLNEVDFFFFLSVLMNIPIAWIILRKSRNPYASTLLFVLSVNYIQEINLVRQCLSMPLCLLALYLLEYKQWKNFLVIIVVAFSFHSSAALILPFGLLFFVNFQTHKDKMRISLTFLWLLSILVFFKIIPVPFLDTMSGLFVDSRYSSYASGTNDMGLDKIGFNYVYNAMMLLIVISMRTKVDIPKIMMMIGCILINFNIPFVNRFALYFTIFMPIFFFNYMTSNAYTSTPNVQGIVMYIRRLLLIYWLFKMFSSNILGDPLLGSKFYNL